MTAGSLPAAAMVAFKLAAVPPEKVPFIARTRPFTLGAGAPNVFARLLDVVRRGFPHPDGLRRRRRQTALRIKNPRPRTARAYIDSQKIVHKKYRFIADCDSVP